jgi:DNA invertase Pin-like site-specific DNA recombinase
LADALAGPAVQQEQPIASDAVGRGVRAAQYVRMSTDLQKYSPENQAAAIASFAAQRNLTIVRTYADHGRSGVRLDGREDLQRLIRDVQSGQADFDVVLVYDISRWGRFQDADEAAYYEFMCKNAGIRVLYCAEQFENDGSLVSAILKNMKRVMAGEYSRELSAKVFAGQCRLVTLGFRQGGPVGYGLRRELIDENGIPKAYLARGEHKSIHTDRIILQPGPTEEVEVVRHVFCQFVSQRKSEAKIARELNRQGITNHYGRPWTRWLIHDLLINENYIGHNVYNRRSFRLGQKMKRNPPSLWVRSDNAFKAIIEPSLFFRAKQIMEQRGENLSDEEMLNRLSALLRENGRLSKRIMDKARDVPCHALYLSRFGSLLRAYKLIGYDPGGNFDYLEVRHSARAALAALVADIITKIESAGGSAAYDPESCVLTINAKVSAFVIIARCTLTRAKYPLWQIDLGRCPRCDLTMVARMDEATENIVDYYLFPRIEVPQRGVVRLRDRKGSYAEPYRFGTLDPLIRWSALDRAASDVGSH